MRHKATECDCVSLEKSVNSRVSEEVYNRLREVASSRLGSVKPSQIVREILEQSMIDGVLSLQGAPKAQTPRKAKSA
jgi:hypothetical protein